MKILMVTERYLPIWGGAENQLSQLIPHLVQRGCGIKIVTRRWYPYLSSEEIVDDVEVVRLGMPGTGFVAVFLFVLSLVCYITKERKNIDILHSHGAVNMGALCSLLASVFKLKNIAKIATAGKITDLQNKWLGRMSLWLFKRSTAIIAMTDEIEKELKTINTPDSTIVRITNGVDINRFAPADALEKERWRKEQGVLPGACVVLFSGRLVYRKGLDILLAIWPEVTEAFPEAKLMILGSGTGQPDSIEAEMRMLVEEKQIDNVMFLGESNHPEFFLGVADVFVFPSRKEGFPNSLMEAMSAGLTIVASNIGGVIPLVDDTETGLLFHLKNKLEFTLKLQKAISDRELQRRVGQKARMLMSTQFSFEKISNSYQDLYSYLLTIKPTRH